MSKNARRFRSVVITVVAVAATNFAIAFASGSSDATSIPPRPKTSGVATCRPESPRPRLTSGTTGVPTRPESPRP